MPYYLYWTVASGLLLVGTSCYWFIIIRNSQIFENMSFRSAIIDLLSHIPSSKSGPLPHVTAGLTSVMGYSLLLSIVVADGVLPPDEFHSFVISTTSLFSGTAFSTVAIWTLWQTRRLEFQTGYKVEDFLDLISHLNREMENLKDSLRHYGSDIQPFHRCYLVTTQPFFGQLTYPSYKETEDFASNLRILAEKSAESASSNRDNRFIFKILCGDAARVDAFHRTYFTSNGKLTVTEEFIEHQNSKVEQAIRQFNELFQEEGLYPFHRSSNIPPVQFMIIGNILFEFTLEEGNSSTAIFNTQVLKDVRYADAYQRTFEILLQNLSSKAASHVSQ